MSASRAAAALTALVLSAGCSVGSSGSASEPAPAGGDAAQRAGSSIEQAVDRYVALGDSYTAAPLVPVTDLAGGCLRSSGNYPQLLAQALGATVTDVSCGGATTAELTSTQRVGGGRGTVPPQLRAVRVGTDLVTVGIGGNDGNLFARIATECIGRERQPRRRCGGLGGAVQEATRVVAETGSRVADALGEVRRSAPRASVVLVGYPRLTDPERSCAGLPLSAADRRAVARLERRLDDALEAAAQAAGAEFLEVHDASRGHEICSDDPWVNGGLTDPGQALAFHPFAVGQQAVADLLEARLRRER